MIEGMKFHVKGEELKALLTARSEWHKNRADALQVNLKQAEDGMSAASAAAQAAGSAKTNVYRRASAEVAYAAASAPRRSYGGNVEDPVAAIQSAITFHTNRAVALDFYSKHLVVDATYVLSESELLKYELVVEVESTEE